MKTHHYAAAIIAAGLALHAAPSAASWTLASLDGDSAGNMFPIAIDNGAGVTGTYNSNGATSSVFAYATTTSISTNPLCFTDDTEPMAVDTTGFFNAGICLNPSTGLSFGFYYITGGQAFSVIVPGAFSTIANGVIHGSAAGYYWIGSTTHGFVYNVAAKTYKTFDPPGSVHTQVNGMSPNGTVYGWYNDVNQVSHGFLYTNGVTTVLDMPGYMDTTPLAMNASGQVVGIVYDGVHFHAMFWQNGAFKTLNGLKEISSSANAITPDGRVGGSEYRAGKLFFGYVWSPATGQVSYAPTPKHTTYLNVAGINSWGQLTGYYQNASGTTAYVATCSGKTCLP